MALKTRETMGQCKRCKDTFDVLIIKHRSWTEIFAGTAATFDYKTGAFTHRCGGQVRLNWDNRWGELFDGFDDPRRG